MIVVRIVPWHMIKSTKKKIKGILSLTVLCALLYVKILFSVLNYKPPLIYNKNVVYLIENDFLKRKYLLLSLFCSIPIDFVIPKY